MSVLRQLPRNSRIISAVSAGGDQRLVHDAVDRRAHEDRLIEQQRDLELLAAAAPASAGSMSRMRCDDVERAGARRSSGSTSAPSGCPRRGPCSSAARCRRARSRRRACRRSCRSTVLIGNGAELVEHSGLRVQRRSGTRWSPIFAVPVGRITFCRPSAASRRAARARRRRAAAGRCRP